jgi:diguanylate cyclase (GGDEF)-like protein
VDLAALRHEVDPTERLRGPERLAQLANGDARETHSTVITRWRRDGQEQLNEARKKAYASSQKLMTGDDLKFRAALSRFGVGVVALVLLPTFYPASRSHAWVWVAYLIVAFAQQVLIRRHIGGETRALWSGLLDIAVLTYTVHNLGSVVTPMSSLYVFAGVANALVTEPAVAYLLGTVGALAFDAVVWAEYFQLVRFAPDAPDTALAGPPTLVQALMASVFVTLFAPACTIIVVALVRAVKKREQQLVETNERLEQLSQRDPLTNLYNRRHLFSALEAELAKVRRGHALSIVMIDLDGFKKVNDTQGHLRGDALLKDIATALASTTRAVDLAARYGGDEFIVVLTNTSGPQALTAAERLAEAMRTAAQRFDPKHPVTASLGVAEADATDTVAALLRRADENAYRAKQSGGNRVVEVRAPRSSATHPATP